jgi:hypothetical protein
MLCLGGHSAREYGRRALTLVACQMRMEERVYGTDPRFDRGRRHQRTSSFNAAGLARWPRLDGATQCLGGLKGRSLEST